MPCAACCHPRPRQRPARRDSPEPRCPSTTTCHPPRCSCGPGAPTATSNSSPPHRPDERRLPRRRRKRTRRAVGPRRVRSCSARRPRDQRCTSFLRLPTVDRLDRRGGRGQRPRERADEDTLVRLEQFRTGTTGHVPRRSQATGPIPRRAAAAGIVATAVAAIAIAYGTSGSRERSDQPASTPRAADGRRRRQRTRPRQSERSHPPTRESATPASPHPAKRIGPRASAARSPPRRTAQPPARTTRPTFGLTRSSHP